MPISRFCFFFHFSYEVITAIVRLFLPVDIATSFPFSISFKMEENRFLASVNCTVLIFYLFEAQRYDTFLELQYTSGFLACTAATVVKGVVSVGSLTKMPIFSTCTPKAAVVKAGTVIRPSASVPSTVSVKPNSL